MAFDVPEDFPGPVQSRRDVSLLIDLEADRNRRVPDGEYPFVPIDGLVVAQPPEKRIVEAVFRHGFSSSSFGETAPRRHLRRAVALPTPSSPAGRRSPKGG